VAVVFFRLALRREKTKNHQQSDQFIFSHVG
jgi:hypothetical protein